MAEEAKKMRTSAETHFTRILNSVFSALFIPRDSTKVGEGRVQANLHAHAQMPPLPPIND